MLNRQEQIFAFPQALAQYSYTVYCLPFPVMETTEKKNAWDLRRIRTDCSFNASDCELGDSEVSFRNIATLNPPGSTKAKHWRI